MFMVISVCSASIFDIDNEFIIYLYCSVVLCHPAYNEKAHFNDVLNMFHLVNEQN